MLKIGRRGSVNIWISVPGKEGHVAYPHLADNPIPRLVRILSRINAITLDTGNALFQPSNIEVTNLHVGNPATNVIPPAAEARLSIRFNDEHSGEGLAAMITALVHEEAPDATVTAKISGEAFRTRPGPWVDLVAEAIRDVTGLEPDRSTTGGTSDARFLHVLAPIVEFGLCNATMHKRDEAVAIPDLHSLTAIYRTVIDRGLAS
jgi:succinyl-diaminopimelate desuccinylase